MRSGSSFFSITVFINFALYFMTNIPKIKTIIDIKHTAIKTNEIICVDSINIANDNINNITHNTIAIEKTIIKAFSFFMIYAYCL